jgi:hypothetical protein
MEVSPGNGIVQANKVKIILFQIDRVIRELMLHGLEQFRSCRAGHPLLFL